MKKLNTITMTVTKIKRNEKQWSNYAFLKGQEDFRNVTKRNGRKKRRRKINEPRNFGKFSTIEGQKNGVERCDWDRERERERQQGRYVY